MSKADIFQGTEKEKRQKYVYLYHFTIFQKNHILFVSICVKSWLNSF